MYQHHSCWQPTPEAAPLLTVHAEGQPQGWLRVVASGEIDMDTAPCLRRALAAALRTRPRRVDVDLSRVSFCDCAALGVLLWAHGHARQQGTDLRLGPLSPLVARVLELTDTSGLLAPDPDSGVPCHDAGARTDAGEWAGADPRMPRRSWYSARGPFQAGWRR